MKKGDWVEWVDRSDVFRYSYPVDGVYQVQDVTDDGCHIMLYVPGDKEPAEYWDTSNWQLSKINMVLELIKELNADL